MSVQLARVAVTMSNQGIAAWTFPPGTQSSLVQTFVSVDAKQDSNVEAFVPIRCVAELARCCCVAIRDAGISFNGKYKWFMLYLPR